MKKVILIDAVNRIIKLVEIDTYKDIYLHLNCDMFEVATELENNDSIYVDEEGLLTNPQHFFEYEGAHQAGFAGNGLVIGTDEEGESVDAKTTLEEVIKKVKFKSIGEVRAEHGIYS